MSLGTDRFQVRRSRGTPAATPRPFSKATRPTFCHTPTFLQSHTPHLLPHPDLSPKPHAPPFCHTPTFLQSHTPHLSATPRPFVAGFTKDELPRVGRSTFRGGVAGSSRWAAVPPGTRRSPPPLLLFDGVEHRVDPAVGRVRASRCALCWS
jgi:hypothetical protein